MMIRSSFLSERRDGDKLQFLRSKGEREGEKRRRMDDKNTEIFKMNYWTPRQILFSAFARTHFSPPSSPYGEYAAHVALCGSRESELLSKLIFPFHVIKQICVLCSSPVMYLDVCLLLRKFTEFVCLLFLAM